MPRYNDDPNFGTEDPTRLELLMCQIQKHGKSEYYGGVHALSVRLPTFVYGSVDALCKHSGLSRNKMICQLLEVALENVFNELSEDDYREVAQLRGDSILSLCEAAGIEQAAVEEC